jgi:hypothetical protein
MLDGLKQRHMLLIACCFGLAVGFLSAILAPRDADLTQRAALGLVGFAVLAIAIYTLLTVYPGKKRAAGRSAVTHPSIGAAINVSARIAFSLSLIFAAVAYAEHASGIQAGEAFAFTFVPAFLLGALHLGAIARRARQFRPPAG